MRSGRGLCAPNMKKKGHSKTQQILEYLGFSALVFLVRLIPVKIVRVVSGLVGSLLYAVIPRRRKIALQNLRIAFGQTMSEKEIKKLARQSCKAFILTAVEMVKSPFRFKNGRVIRDRRYKSEHLEDLFQKAKMIHDEAGGCIFLTPHLGNWELLPYVSSLIGIPLAIVIRPLDNPYLERAILSSRIGSGQIMIPKVNAMFSLDRILRKGKSVGMLPDQSTGRGLRVEFFGESATVTPVPALLAIRHGRPVVVVAACRTKRSLFF